MRRSREQETIGCTDNEEGLITSEQRAYNNRQRNVPTPGNESVNPGEGGGEGKYWSLIKSSLCRCRFASPRSHTIRLRRSFVCGCGLEAICSIFAAATTADAAADAVAVAANTCQAYFAAAATQVNRGRRG